MCQVTATYFTVTVETELHRTGVEQVSDGNGADEGSDLQQHAEDEEHEVQDEHGEAQLSAHPPATGGDGDDDEEQHEEEQHNGAEQAVGADGNGLPFVQQDEQEPRNRQTETRDRRVLELSES